MHAQIKPRVWTILSVKVLLDICCIRQCCFVRSKMMSWWVSGRVSGYINFPICSKSVYWLFKLWNGSEAWSAIKIIIPNLKMETVHVLKKVTIFWHRKLLYFDTMILLLTASQSTVVYLSLSFKYIISCWIICWYSIAIAFKLLTLF